MTAADARTVLSGWALAAIACGFLLIGLVASAYGPLLGFLSHRFAVSLPVAGEVLSAHFAGGLLGVIVSMRATERVPNRHLVAGGLAALGLGCAMVAIAPAWPVLLAAVFVVGIGFGSLDLCLNQIVAHSGGMRRTAVLNVLNGSFGIGAVLGPIFVTVLGENRFFILYAVAAVLSLALIVEARRIPGRLPVAPPEPGGRPNALVLVFVLAFALYVGTEAGVGGWAASHLVSIGHTAGVAAAVTSGFWLALGVGRFLVALVPQSVREAVIVTAAAALGGLALLCATFGPAAPAAYVLTGLAIAPIFPTGVVWLAKLLPRDARATSWLFPAAMVGGAVIPAGIGLVVARVGLGGVPVVLFAVAIGMFLAFGAARRMGAREAGSQL